MDIYSPECPTFGTLQTALLKLQCEYESSEDLDKMQMLMLSGMGLKFCKSNQLPNDADAAGPWTSLSSKAITLYFLPRSNYLQT